MVTHSRISCATGAIFAGLWLGTGKKLRPKSIVFIFEESEQFNVYPVDDWNDGTSREIKVFFCKLCVLIRLECYAWKTAHLLYDLYTGWGILENHDKSPVSAGQKGLSLCQGWLPHSPGLLQRSFEVQQAARMHLKRLIAGIWGDRLIGREVVDLKMMLFLMFNYISPLRVRVHFWIDMISKHDGSKRTVQLPKWQSFTPGLGHFMWSPAIFVCMFRIWISSIYLPWFSSHWILKEQLVGSDFITVGVFQVMNNFQVNFCPDGIQQWLIAGITTQLPRFSTPTTSNALALQPYASVSGKAWWSWNLGMKTKRITVTVRQQTWQLYVQPLLLEVLREANQLFSVVDTSCAINEAIPWSRRLLLST